jgi:phosphoglycerol transferase MdoB-like AlkP superfamily enzyme
MKHSIVFVIRLVLFWMLFFFIQRLVFMAVNIGETGYTTREFLLSQLKALPMDLAATCYIIIIPLLALIAAMFTGNTRIPNRIIQAETVMMIVVCALICSGDAGIYKVWGTKINSKALSYLAYPAEVLPTLIAVENLGLLFIVAAQILAFNRLRKRMVVLPQQLVSIRIIPAIATSLLLIGLTVIGLRGGLQRVPINRNWVFFSKHAVLNFASLNGFWNFADLATRPIDAHNNPYAYMPPEDASRTLSEMHAQPADSTVSILNTTRPNIAIIFLESWAADVVGCVGGEADVAPKFGELAKEGMLFSDFYSTGFRTEQGMLAVLSAYPSQPVSSIIQHFGKFDKLPNLYKVMNEQGYHTSFYTGGRLQFDNVEAYLRAAGVQRMVGEDQFTINKRTVWGAYDEETFAQHLRDLEQTPQPFFTSLTTMTTHEWYDANVPQIFSGDQDQVCDKYRNTMHYADSCLYAYIKEAQKQPWYANTLFVLVADHASKFPKGRSNFDRERHHIPMLLIGGALKKELAGTVNNRVASHIDIAASLLSQMQLPANEFPRSKNMFNPNAPAFAYYAFDNGFGFITSGKTVIFDHNQQKDLMEHTPSDTLANILEYWGKAYLQTNFQENLDYAQVRRK